MAQPLRVGLLGCAEIAWRNVLPAFQRVPDVVVTAVASRTPPKAEQYAARFGAAPVVGYAALLARTDVDLVYIALPASLHHMWARRALNAGKHVLLEKPLTVSLAEAEDLVTVARKQRRWLTENLMFQHHSQHAAVRERIARGDIGVPQAFSAAFGIPRRAADDIRYRAELGGGALLDVGVYPTRAASLLLGDDLDIAGAVLRVDADGVDLSGAALLHTPGGVTADLTFGFESAYRSTYAVWGSEGRISLDRAFTPPPSMRPTLRLCRQDHVQEFSLPPDDQYANLIRGFVASIRSGSDFAPHGEELVRQAATVERIRRAARLATPTA